GMNQFGIERIGHAELEQGKDIGETELCQRVLEVGVSEGGTDEAERGLALFPARHDAIHAMTACTGPESAIAVGETLFATPRARRQQHIFFKIDPGRVEFERVVRVDAGKMIAMNVNGSAAIGLVRGDKIAD